MTRKAPRLRQRIGRLLAASALAALAATGGLAPAVAAPGTTARVVGPDQKLPLEVRQGRLIRLPRPAAAVFVADPQIADVQAHSPTLVYVFGRRSGTTTLFAVDDQEDVLLQREIDVEHHLSGLQRVLGEAAPDSSISVRSVDGGIVLAGTVADPVKAQEVRDIASRYLGENETLINHLEVAAPTQVNLRVRVAEVSRDVTKLFGVNWEAAFQTGNFVFGLASGRAFTSGGGFPFQRLTDQSGTANALLGRYASNHADINSIIDALESDGLVNILAEPNLTALSGETASFLAGGEFPIPVGQDTTTNKIEIQFKQFGVSLAFTPTVLGADRISLRVRPEVSDLSDKGAIKLGDLAIPGLATRRAETTVELGSGESFAIGGLVSNSTRNSLSKFPGLGDLPVLGTLFRSTNFQRSESELVILVTPYLVRPVSSTQLMSPLDGNREPTDLNRILKGRLAQVALRPGSPSQVSTSVGRLAGPAGFVMN